VGEKSLVNYFKNLLLVPLQLGFVVTYLLYSWTSYAAGVVNPEKIYAGNIYYFSQVPNTLFLLGEVEANTAIDFRRAIRNHDVNRLVLASPGGRVDGGLELAAIVSDKGISTYVPENAECSSACSFIFFGGRERISAGSLGLHQISTKSDAKVSINDSFTYVQSSVSDIIAILNSFDTPSFVYEHMFSTEASQMYYLNEAEYNLIERGNREPWHDESERFLAELTDSMRLSVDSSTASDSAADDRETPNTQPPPKPGHTVLQVSRLQRALNSHNCEAGVVDGIVGPQTDNAIGRFLSASGLSESDLDKYDIDSFSDLVERTPRPKCSADPVSPALKSRPQTTIPTTISSLGGKWLVDLSCKTKPAWNFRGSLLISSKRKQLGASYEYEARIEDSGGHVSEGVVIEYFRRREGALQSHTITFSLKPKQSGVGVKLTRSGAKINSRRSKILDEGGFGSCRLFVRR